ncbi:MAG: hypothetical protein JNN15_21575, partial [Blastocatellia bacterium]|nr:hypothetical protein [Blastocatellia bacterium]
LSNPTNAIIAQGTGTGTITNDDPIPSLSINNATVTEGNSGTVNAVFTVSISNPSFQPVTVMFATANGTATAGSDYTATTGTLTFPANSTASQTISVPVIGDLLVEPDETFTVTLSNPTNATIATGQGTGTITNDDAVTLSINNATVTEGNSGTVNAVFTVSISGTSTQPVTVDFATADGTATAGSDYTSTTGTLTFPA